MPQVARGNGNDTVYSLTGTGLFCLSPVTTATNECSSDTFVNGIGVVREGDKVAPHNSAGCGTDASVLTVFSSVVIINNKGAGRKGDFYTPDNEITTGSEDTFFG